MDDLRHLNPAELEADLKKNHARDKELDNLNYDIFAENIMEKIEERRKELKKISPVYTQKYLSEKAGISLSTYKNYLNGYNTGFSLMTLKKIVDALGCKPSDFLD